MLLKAGIAALINADGHEASLFSRGRPAAMAGRVVAALVAMACPPPGRYPRLKVMQLTVPGMRTGLCVRDCPEQDAPGR